MLVTLLHVGDTPLSMLVTLLYVNRDLDVSLETSLLWNYKTKLGVPEAFRTLSSVPCQR